MKEQYEEPVIEVIEFRTKAVTQTSGKRGIRSTLRAIVCLLLRPHCQMLNDSSALIFERLQKGNTPEETALALTQEYDAALETASADVRSTFASLIKTGVAEA